MVKTDNEFFSFLKNGNPLLTGQSEHTGHRGLIPGKIELLKDDSFPAKELLRCHTARSGWQ